MAHHINCVNLLPQGILGYQRIIGNKKKDDPKLFP